MSTHWHTIGGDGVHAAKKANLIVIAQSGQAVDLTADEWHELVAFVGQTGDVIFKPRTDEGLHSERAGEL